MLSEEDPDSARGKFELANALDYTGRTEQAIPLYESALEMGLDEEGLPCAMIQLGISLLAVGSPADAMRILEKVEKKFPSMEAASFFRALAPNEVGKEKDALRAQANTLLEKSSGEDAKTYAQALKNYFENRQ